MKYSLSHRLILAAVLLLAAFLGVAGFALHTLYEKRAMTSLENELIGHVYTLLSAAKEDQQGLILLPDMVPDPRLNRPDSGLYATVRGHRAGYRWQSASSLGQAFEQYKPAAAGEKNYSLSDSQLVLNFGVAWDDLSGESWDYTISIAANLEPFRQDMSNFRKGLVNWLGGSALILLLVQVVVLRWGLNPLKTAAGDIKKIESGKLEKLEGHYPEELRVLTDNINSLIAHGIANQQRYRNSLGDLAHSLKTPLALLQAARENDNADELQKTLDEQLPHINALLQYYLQRASVMGKTSLAQAIALKPVIEKIIRGLDKVYQEKQVKTRLRVAEDAMFYGDMGDLMELMGNLLENAYKYGDGQVVVTVQPTPELKISVEDNGPGIAGHDRQRLLQRGVRADQQQSGQGLGLSIVNEIVSLYKARLSIQQSQLGGALFVVEF